MVLSLLAGAALGAGGHWYFADHLPKVRMMAMAKEQQEQLNKMVRSGDVVSVKPDEITIKVTHSGDPQFNGKTITVKTDQYTSVQAGMDFISKPGQATDLTKYLKPGIHVDLLVNGNKAVAVHWNPPGQGQPGQK
ncbi:hypothetical protein A6M21_07555 [Desulfotomaculum copahuensis]|uniref:DUF5666 domain-containing protein n=1 Tax=Desulfotomaculum copahuensis TaxID=1838280 RepID=A0A1B7LG28_9FIRM|nr:hypothetical protein A6M21_07555 [Desulfotomaculum copahuensis]